MSNSNEPTKRLSNEILDSIGEGDARLGQIYRHAMAVHPSLDHTALIMKAVAESQPPNRFLMWVLAYGSYIGVGIFLICIVPLLLFLPVPNIHVDSFSIATPKESIPLWTVVTVTILGLGIWRMETA